MSKMFIVYDGRACGNQGTDNAAIMVSCESNKEAKSYREDFGCQLACYSYDIEDGYFLINEKWEWDYNPE